MHITVFAFMHVCVIVCLILMCIFSTCTNHSFIQYEATLQHPQVKRGVRRSARQ